VGIQARTRRARISLSAGEAITRVTLAALASEGARASEQALGVGVTDTRGLLAQVDGLAALAIHGRLESFLALASELAGAGLDAGGLRVADVGASAGIDLNALVTVGLVARVALAGVLAGASLGARGVRVARVGLAVIDLVAGLAITVETVLAGALVFAGASLLAGGILVAGGRSSEATVDLNAAGTLLLETNLAIALVQARAGLDALSVGVARRGVASTVVNLLAGLAITREAGLALASELARSQTRALSVGVARGRIANIDFLAVNTIAFEALLARAGVSAGTSLLALGVLVARRRIVQAVVDLTATSSTTLTVTDVTLTALALVQARASLETLGVLVTRVGSTVVDLNARALRVGLEALVALALEVAGVDLLALGVVVARVRSAGIDLLALLALHLEALLALALVGTRTSLLAGRGGSVTRLLLARVDLNTLAAGALLVAGLAVAGVSTGTSGGADSVGTARRGAQVVAVVEGLATSTLHLVALVADALVNTGAGLLALGVGLLARRIGQSARVDLQAATAITGVAGLADARVSALRVRNALGSGTAGDVARTVALLLQHPGGVNTGGGSGVNSTQASAVVVANN